MSYHHFSKYERGQLQALLEEGFSHRTIAQKLNRHHSTVSREIFRNSFGKYQAEKAEANYQKRRISSKPVGKISTEIRTIIEEQMVATWSPEQIVNRLTSAVPISFKTIYNWLYQEKLPHYLLTCLRQKGKRRKPTETRGKIQIGYSIHQRPKEVTDRKQFGHWELDTMVSSRGQSKGCLATFVERTTRLYLAFKIPDRTSSSMNQAISALLKKLPQKAMKTATVDRGKEFSGHEILRKESGLILYFADAYCSWQRGANENANGLMRQFFPKKTDLALVEEEKLQKALFLINSRPRKCLGWKTPYEAFFDKMSHLN